MAQSGFSTKNGFNANPCGLQQISAATLATAQLLTAPARGKAQGAVMRVEGGNVRWTDDGTVPTAAIGILMTPTDPPFEYTGSLEKFQVILASGAPILSLSYYNMDD